MLFLRATSSFRPSLASTSPTVLLTRQLSSPVSKSTTRTLRVPSLFRHPARPLAVAFGLSLPFLAPSRPTLNDSSLGPAQLPSLSGQGESSSPFSSSAPDAATGGKKDVPVFKDGSLNPAAVKQISLGGMLGLGAGVLLSMFSRMLVLVLGVGIVVWQYAARKGYNIIPVERLQRYAKGVNVRSAIQQNVAFKISFGLVFALTAFGEF
ncbi:uncharacterized protein HMPREF1541_04854 [Cyphellophora europaea CBS 101466]|uniref:FUN14 domain-containing protein n=1 Tax=Cyphellophora europaea (strain CBS 101466) TaxID=1220924 RepID=W2RVV0_CYPE1|nr:uncharacterized protein HMPREF1541_04854 [Cyphellophora europaea CBS 101466]ETN40577.1 hypothetical protein HMPREF1541_04854 [Cyphellophora europaea CBS 101466]